MNHEMVLPPFRLLVIFSLLLALSTTVFAGLLGSDNFYIIKKNGDVNVVFSCAANQCVQDYNSYTGGYTCIPVVGGASGNPFDQDLNTTNTPTFNGLISTGTLYLTKYSPSGQPFISFDDNAYMYFDETDVPNLLGHTNFLTITSDNGDKDMVLQMKNFFIHDAVDNNTKSGVILSGSTGDINARCITLADDQPFCSKPISSTDTNLQTYGAFNPDNNSFLIDVNAGTHNLMTDKNVYVKQNLKVGNLTDINLYRVDVQGTAQNDGIRTWTGVDFLLVSRPTSLSVALAGVGAGSVDNGLHYYGVTFYTALGESKQYGLTGSLVSVTVADKTVNGKVTVTIPTSTDPRVVGRKIYRTKAGASQWVTYLVDTVANNIDITYLDNKADSALTGTVGSGYNQANTTNKYITMTVDGTTNQAIFLDPNTTKFGFNAGATSTLGIRSTFFGAYAGYGSNSIEDFTVIGNNAGRIRTAGNGVVAIGSGANYSGNTGAAGTYVGTFAGYNDSGSGNTTIGNGTNYLNLAYPFTGNYNTYLGYYNGRTYMTPQAITYGMSLGSQAYPWYSYQTVLGTYNQTTRAEIFGDTRIMKATSLGTEKLANGTFTGSATSWTLGTGWAYGTNNVVKTTGVGTLSQALVDMNTPIVVGETYYLSFVLTDLSGGTLTASIGGETLTASAGNATYTFIVTATNTNPLTFTPSVTGVAVTVDTVSLKKITGGSLTIGGNFKTQGNAIFDNNVGIGTTTPANKLNVVGDINASGASGNIFADQNISTGTKFIAKGFSGIDFNAHVLKDADLVGLTKTYCDMNFIGGILVASTC